MSQAKAEGWEGTESECEAKDRREIYFTLLFFSSSSSFVKIFVLQSSVINHSSALLLTFVSSHACLVSRILHLII
jgi:hypothetical protein